MAKGPNQLEQVIMKIPENTIIEASPLYTQLRDIMTETAYYKALERMCKSGRIQHLTKGLYYRPQITRYGARPISEDDIVNHYTKSHRGCVVGYRMYNAKGITTQISKNVDVVTNVLQGHKKNIRNVRLSSCELDFDATTVSIIEVLEILNNYKKIENINNRAVGECMRDFALHYSDNDTVIVLEYMHYKKSTIAFLRDFLNHHEVPNTLGRYLSALSNYANPPMELFYEST